jgi:hypothetical protein
MVQRAMSRPRLSARFLDEGDGTGQLTVRAESNGFSGVAEAWFHKDQVQVFAACLESFPLTIRHELAGGFWSATHPQTLDCAHLALAVYPVNTRGYVGVHVKLAAALEDPTHPESQGSVSLGFVTLHTPVAEFGKALAQLIEGAIVEAVLEGD